MLKLVYALVTKKYIPNSLWNQFSYRAKFISRSLLTPLHSKPWLTYLANHPMLTEILSAQPSLPCKLHRPYLAKNLTKTEQLYALIHHYDFIQQLPTQLLQTLYKKEGNYLLAEITGKSETKYRCLLHAEDQLNREGELTISFVNQHDIVLARVTFIIMFYQNKTTLFIGGQQGAAPETDHKEIQHATKECHGLFPKRLIIDAVRNLCSLLDIQQIIAIGNQAHIYHNWRYALKKRKFLTNYDEFWITLNGTEAGSGYYNLPIETVHRPLEELPSKKRAEYRRRYQLIDALQEDINTRYQAIKLYQSSSTPIQQEINADNQEAIEKDTNSALS